PDPAGAVFDVNISAQLTDLDGSETLSIVVGNVPEGATLSAGTDNGDGTWTLTPAQLDGLQLITEDAVSEAFSLSVTATSTETANGDAASTSLNVTVSPPDTGASDPTLTAS